MPIQDEFLPKKKKKHELGYFLIVWVLMEFLPYLRVLDNKIL